MKKPLTEGLRGGQIAFFRKGKRPGLKGVAANIDFWRLMALGAEILCVAAKITDEGFRQPKGKGIFYAQISGMVLTRQREGAGLTFPHNASQHAVDEAGQIFKAACFCHIHGLVDGGRGRHLVHKINLVHGGPQRFADEGLQLRAP
jgi:hypothetical protein